MTLLEDLNSLADSSDSSAEVKAAAAAAAEQILSNDRSIRALKVELDIARSVVHQRQSSEPSMGRLARVLHNASPDIVALLGALVFSVGAGLVYRPAGLIAFGALLLWSGITAARN